MRQRLARRTWSAKLSGGSLGHRRFLGGRCHVGNAARLLVACAALASCARGPEPCLNAGACGEGEECLANRCVPEGGEGVPMDSLRLVCGLSRASTQAPLTLEFDPRWASFERVDAAFLLLEAQGEPGHSLRVRARSVGAQKTQSGLISPMSEGLVEPPGTMRIDVTELVRSWQGSKSTPHAITLEALDGAPLRLSLGTADGAAPRLEVYGR